MSNPVPFPVTAFEKLADSEARHWWFRARNKLLLWALAKKVKPFDSFLEVGCGTGFVLEGISKAFPTVSLFGAEYFSEGMHFATERVPKASFRQLDARLMSDVERYDAIGAFDVIEHIDEDELVLLNFANALEPGGAVLITVPQHKWLWSAADEHACHVRRYSREDLVAKVKRAGFEIDYVTSFVSLLVPLMWLSRRGRHQDRHDPESEFKISDWLNWFLERVMQIEFLLIKLGVNFPVGGSLLLIARKPSERLKN